ncbi:MAG: hypothetical protein AAB601_01350, partial [Patescibacteria group bacterium]
MNTFQQFVGIVRRLLFGADLILRWLVAVILTWPIVMLLVSLVGVPEVTAVIGFLIPTVVLFLLIVGYASPTVTALLATE